MGAVTLETISAIVFAVGAVVTVAAVALAPTLRVPPIAYIGLGALLAAAAAAAWVGFAFKHDPGIAVAAGGLTVCALAQLPAIMLRDAAARQRRVAEELADAEARLHAVVERETRERAEE